MHHLPPQHAADDGAESADGTSGDATASGAAGGTGARQAEATPGDAAAAAAPAADAIAKVSIMTATWCMHAVSLAFGGSP